ncbi:hypothetical protein EGH10_20945 [Brevibacillus laterosporus]|uniref:Uncharacterized protein n=1 Tax=Brevibacillus laterosporus LMG 15441 TaxID=1042163 RepID=A0A075R828_BRELA|nr:hypothetical protein [Brevibacillus laterosporus]AIG27418.1 hypothetical protein BRLA_c031060 [Brevibacillus laterosporus LMG 15441]RJL15349.1 hypothetical protein DM460_00170 [Brevibacillus laterosporus]TPH06487.1 hypothetical protein EGH10_20945 [Brevibacillus laterosporus]
MEYALSTGKKIIFRKKKGPHHLIERNLLSAVQGQGGANFGGLSLSILVKAVVGIESVGGVKIEVPDDIVGLLEFMDHFEYDEWDEVESLILTPQEKQKFEEAAKNLLESPGSEVE